MASSKFRSRLPESHREPTGGALGAFENTGGWAWLIGGGTSCHVPNITSLS